MRCSNDPAYLSAAHPLSSVSIKGPPLTGTGPVLAAPVWTASTPQIQQQGR